MPLVYISSTVSCMDNYLGSNVTKARHKFKWKEFTSFLK